MGIAIKVDHLSKAYQLGEIGTGTVSRDLERWIAKIRGKEDPFLMVGETNDRTVKGTSDVVWSLKDVSCEIRQGEAVGIIGRNGAGKSTLLKLLSRVTSPTSGSIKVKGRIASLLEVGTGFHPELTGRENIYLNGAILGMRKKEISRKFDEILDFSGVERYVDTPVKRYSSGMYVRLAFAVAAYLESEILVVDEVLAVGDAEFQKKCLGKMSDVSKGEGRTVLFVSHNMGAIATLCTSSILMHHGKIIGYGPTADIIEQYVTNDKEKSGEVTGDNIVYKQRCSKGYFNALRILSEGVVSDNVTISREVQVEMEYTITEDGTKIIPSMHLLDNYGACIFAATNFPSASLVPDEFFGKPLKAGRYKSVCTIPPNFLNDVSYRINVFLFPENNYMDMAIVEDALSFSVLETGEMRKEYTGLWMGLIRPKVGWETKILELH